MNIIKGGVTAPRGFLAAAVNCGIKKSKRDDLALLCSEKPSLLAATFTTNRVRSGSVILSEKRSKGGSQQAVIVNSGNANCCAGKKEFKNAEAMTDLVAKKLDLGKNKVLVASTGIIGRPLPINKIKNKIPSLVKTLKKTNGTRFAKAIMTTDTVHKEIAVKINIGSNVVKIGGAVKGSGMICPNMATMLAFFTTDGAIEKSALRAAFRERVSQSFNRITVDGDMSTNDSAFLFANGLAGNRSIKKGSADHTRFLNALKFVAIELAKRIVLDGEGATKFVEIVVKGAKSEREGDVADSSLIKTMIAGGDPNWGRVAASVGSGGEFIKKNKVDIYFGKRIVMRNGASIAVAKKPLLSIFKKKEILITIDLKSGTSSSKVWTCDLTEEYVRINAEYEA